MSEQDEYEARLRQRLEVLQEQLAQGKVRFEKHLADETLASLEAVRYRSDGEIDLTTVDGTVRSLAMGVAGIVWRQEAKDAISVQDAQSNYFDVISHTFGEISKLTDGSDLTPDQIAEGVSRDEGMVAQAVALAKDFVPAIREFWDAAHDPVSYHLSDLNGSKGVFGGDLFPSGSKSIASTCSLYLDTIVLSDPFLKSEVPLENLSEKEAARMFIKHGMNVLKYRDLALANCDTPIVAILPSDSGLNADRARFLGELSENDALAHAKRLFGVEFDDIAALQEFCGEIVTSDDLLLRLKDRERLLFDTDWTDPIEGQIARAMKEIGTFGLAETVGNQVLMQCIGRSMQANDVLLQSSALRGSPLIEAPTSWKYFQWFQEYGAMAPDDEDHSLHMVHGLQYAGNTDVQWLGNIPHSSLIAMRETDALPEIREMLQRGVKELAGTNPEGFYRTADLIVDNIDAAYAKHIENVEHLRSKKWEFVGHDLGSWLVTGSIGVSAALFAQPVLALGALAADQLLDAPKLRDLPRRFAEIRNGKKHLENSPMGLFFSHA